MPEECPQEVVTLIKDCMVSEPQARPTTRDIFNTLKVHFCRIA